MINKVSGYDSYGKKHPNITFGAKRIAPEVANKINKELASFKTLDIYPHLSIDYDTACSAIFEYKKLESKGVLTHLCTSAMDLLNLGFNPKNYRLKTSSKPAEAAYILDFNGKDKLISKHLKRLNKTKTIIEVDHHPHSEQTFNTAYSYNDTTAKSCCSILFRKAESTNDKLSLEDLQILYRGMISDFEKSKRIKFESTPQGSIVVKQSAMEIDTNSAEVLDRIEKLLPLEERIKINNDLDIISNLTPKEKEFQKMLSSNVKVSPNGKLAYVVIAPEEKALSNQWKELGFDNMRTSAILGDFRRRLLNGVEKDSFFRPETVQKLKNPQGKIDIQGAIIFYPTTKSSELDNAFQFSIHSKKDTKLCKKWIEHVKYSYAAKEKYKSTFYNLIHPTKLKHPLSAGGHDDRSGGRIFTYNKKSRQNLIDSFLEAAENVE